MYAYNEKRIVFLAFKKYNRLYYLTMIVKYTSVLARLNIQRTNIEIAKNTAGKDIISLL